MDALDIILIAILVGSFVHGLRLGAVVQILSFLGAIVGVAIGVGLVALITPHLHGQFSRTFVSLLLLILPAATIWGAGRQLGARAWRRIRRNRLAPVDAAVGALVAVAGTFVVIWLLASLLVNSQVNLVSSQIQRSGVIRAAADVLPPVPNELAAVERLLNQSGFPLPYVGFLQPVGPVALPSSPQVRSAVLHDGRSTVQVIAIGCGNLVQYGSGFVVAPGLVVTNAHVVAGTRQITVRDEVGEHQSTVVLYDPRYDLAVLRVPTLNDPTLRLDAGYVARGQKGAVLGYPGGGPFDAQAAGVLMRFDPVSTDIYGNSTVQRELYEIQSYVRPGNSGGPLVEPDGLVVGVVFSRDSSNDHIGFALASPGVLARVHEAEARVASGAGPQSTESCVND